MKHLPFLKKTAAAVMSAAMLVTSLAIPTAATESFESADSAVKSITAGWNLGNALDSCGEWIGLYTDEKPQNYETAWNNPVTTKKLITAVKNAGFDAVRVPVTWDEHIDSKGNIDKEWLDRVQEVADYVISQDMYCVLNVHHDAGADGWLKASAECYKNNSGKLSAPTLKAVKSTDKLTLKWTAVNGVDSYVIYKYDAKTKKYVKLKTVNGTSYTIKSPKSGSYRFAVCAVKKSGGKSTNGERSKAVNVTV